MLKHPPEFLITTPESLYLRVTVQLSLAHLHRLDAVIASATHPCAGNKRRSQLTL